MTNKFLTTEDPFYDNDGSLIDEDAMEWMEIDETDLDPAMLAEEDLDGIL